MSPGHQRGPVAGPFLSSADPAAHKQQLLLLQAPAAALWTEGGAVTHAFTGTTAHLSLDPYPTLPLSTQAGPVPDSNSIYPGWTRTRLYLYLPRLDPNTIANNATSPVLCIFFAIQLDIIVKRWFLIPNKKYS